VATETVMSGHDKTERFHASALPLAVRVHDSVFLLHEPADAGRRRRRAWAL